MTTNRNIVSALTEMYEINNRPELDPDEFKLAILTAESFGLEWIDSQDLRKGIMYRQCGRGSGYLKLTIKSLLRKYHL